MIELVSCTEQQCAGGNLVFRMALGNADPFPSKHPACPQAFSLQILNASDIAEEELPFRIPCCQGSEQHEE